MSDLKDTVVTYVDEQLHAILMAPGMWGSPESVEFQFLQLLEFRSVTLRPELEKVNPRSVLEEYHRFLKEEFPGAPSYPLFRLVEKYDRKMEFVSLLKKFSEHLKQQMRPSDVMQSHDLILKLVLSKQIRVPRASVLSSYYDVFHRVLRAVSRRQGTRGLASHDVEEAIDFTLPEVIVNQANGAPASIILPLDQPETAEADDVKRGLESLVAMNEWAAIPGSPVASFVNSLSEEDHDRPERIAVQALRLVPGEDLSIQQVELGGRLVGRATPIAIKPEFGERMVKVVRARRKGRKFDELGTIRAVDIDQRSMRIKAGSRTIKCWINEQVLLGRAKKALGQYARVVGTIYETPGSPAVIDVDNIIIK
jgi:hypothetical protein